jgi:hypothetical protein
MQCMPYVCARYMSSARQPRLHVDRVSAVLTLVSGLGSESIQYAVCYCWKPHAAALDAFAAWLMVNRIQYTKSCAQTCMLPTSYKYSTCWMGRVQPQLMS